MISKILSVIIPSYNVEMYLPKCLDSLIVRDYDLLKLLDVIVVNDGSKDRTSEIAHSFKLKYPDMFRVIDKENGHYGSCINAGLKIAKGYFTKILDADDSFCTESLSALLSELLELVDVAAPIDMVLTPYAVVNEGGVISRNIGYDLNERICYSIDDILPIAPKIAMHAIAYRTNMIKEMGYRQTEGVSYTDTEWCFMPMTRVKRIRYSNNVVYKYLVGREGQTVGKASTVRNFWMYQDLVARLIGWQTQEALSPIHKKYLDIRVESLCGYLYQTIIRWVPIKSALKEFDLLDKTLSRNQEVYNRLSKMTLSKVIQWRYVRFMRKHAHGRALYLLQLRLYLGIKGLIIG